MIAKALALDVAEYSERSFELPAIPSFAMLVDDHVVIIEQKSSRPMTDMLDGLLRRSESSDSERRRLEGLTERYRELLTERGGDPVA